MKRSILVVFLVIAAVFVFVRAEEEEEKGACPPHRVAHFKEQPTAAKVKVDNNNKAD